MFITLNINFYLHMHKIFHSATPAKRKDIEPKIDPPAKKKRMKIL